MNMAPVEGWITLDTAKDLFKRAGLDYDAAKAAANKPGFKAVPMTGVSRCRPMRIRLSHIIHTRNVVGVVRGSKHPDEYVLYTAHWDHLGVKPDVPGPDKIYNGAVDNGMGVSSILEIARDVRRTTSRIRSAPSPSSAGRWKSRGCWVRNISRQHPLWPLSHIVAGINLDANLPEGRAHDMIVVGSGASELEDMLANDLKTQNRVITTDPEPEKGYFYRSDHISLAKVGVPMLYPGGGFDLVDGGKVAGKAVRDDYRIHHYHQPSDEYNPNWDLSGPVQDLDVLYTLGDEIANSDVWPNWYKDNEFRAARDKTMAGKN